MFTEGVEYSRARDVHEQYGGQTQGGISTPSGKPYIFIFTGKSGEQHGYADGWVNDDVFTYVGEGQIGDMRFAAGNKAIRDHALEGKDLLLFEALGKSKPVRFLGRFACQSWEIVVGPDKSGADRNAIRFHLVKLPTTTTLETEAVPAEPGKEPLTTLRERAYAAARPQQTKQLTNSLASYRQRSAAVREYVLARAAGKCELTGISAPFQTKSGQPYLEVHHVRRLSDDGPDHPRYVAAICPTIHREIHFGAKGSALNDELEVKLKAIEP